MTAARSKISIEVIYRALRWVVAVPVGTTVHFIWEEAAGILEIPEDVEAFIEGTQNPKGFGLPWDHRFHEPTQLVFQEYEYSAA